MINSDKVHPCLTDIVSVCDRGISYSLWVKLPRPTYGTLLYHRRHNTTHHGTGMEITLDGINVVVESFTNDVAFKAEVGLFDILDTFRINKHLKIR